MLRAEASWRAPRNIALDVQRYVAFLSRELKVQCAQSDQKFMKTFTNLEDVQSRERVATFEYF